MAVGPAGRAQEIGTADGRRKEGLFIKSSPKSRPPQRSRTTCNCTPIHHQLIERVEAHIFVAFLAYCLHVTLHGKAQAAGDRPHAEGRAGQARSRPDARRSTSRPPTAAPSSSAAIPNSTQTKRSSSASSTSNCPRSPRHGLPPPATSPERQPTPCSEDFLPEPPFYGHLRPLDPFVGKVGLGGSFRPCVAVPGASQDPS